MGIVTIRLNTVANPATLEEVYAGIATVHEVHRQGHQIREVRIVVTPQEEAGMEGQRLLAEHCRRATGKTMAAEMVKQFQGGVFETLAVVVETYVMEVPEGQVLDVVTAEIVKKMPAWAPRGLVITARSSVKLAEALATLKARGRDAKFGVVVALPTVEEWFEVQELSGWAATGGEKVEHWREKKW